VVATAAALTVVALTHVSPVYAGTDGQASHTQTVTSGTFAALATTASTPPYTTAALTLSFGTLGLSTIYFNVVNTGNFTLIGSTYSLSAANLGVAGAVTVKACVGGTWNESTNACTGGTATTVATSTGSTTTTSQTASGRFPAAAAASIRMQATLTGILNVNTTGTFGVTVSRTAEVRAATTTNS